MLTKVISGAEYDGFSVRQDLSTLTFYRPQRRPAVSEIQSLWASIKSGVRDLIFRTVSDCKNAIAATI